MVLILTVLVSIILIFKKMQEKSNIQNSDRIAPIGSPRARMFDNFVNSVKMDVSKCVGFALAFFTPEDILNIVQNTFDKYLNEEPKKDIS